LLFVIPALFDFSATNYLSKAYQIIPRWD